MKNIRILVAEDDERLRTILLKYLTKEGYEGLGAADGDAALDLWVENRPDLVILDVGLPGTDGFEVLRTIRAEEDIPVLMLTARREEADKLTGFGLGADDYVTKPFSPRELMVRIAAILRRSGVLSTAKEITAGPLTIYPGERKVVAAGEAVEIPGKEYELLLYFLGHRGQILTRGQLIDRLWGYDFDGDPRVVDTTIKRLRKKLGAAGSVIETVRGVGYRFNDDLI